MKKFYITTPLYYVNDVPHIGHAYTNIAADTLARYKRFLGFDVHLLTGTDEHGQKIQEAAKEQGLLPIELADRMLERFKSLWKALSIEYTDFIRTTEERHIKGVKKFINAVRNDIYLGKYKGWYCTPCESFWTKKEIKDVSICPSCKRGLKWVEEEAYFFALPKYKEKILQYIQEGVIEPSFRKTEVLNMLKEQIPPLCISRTSFEWGIPLEGKHVLYVWFDALLNYITAIGYGEDEERFKRLWPADIHIIGKDILRFHAIIWPGMLLSASLPLPKMIFAHGWWTVKGEKMSKSLGNVVDPFDVIKKVGADGLRYFLLREVPFGQDGDFSPEALVQRVNSELANDLGNLVKRTTTLLERHFEGKIEPQKTAEELKNLSLSLGEKVDEAMQKLQFSLALSSIYSVIHACNKYLDENVPWRLIEEGRKKEAKEVLYNLLESVRIVTIFLYPFIPTLAEKIWRSIGMNVPLSTQRKEDTEKWGVLPSTTVSSCTIYERIK